MASKMRNLIGVMFSLSSTARHESAVALHTLGLELESRKFAMKDRYYSPFRVRYVVRGRRRGAVVGGEKLTLAAVSEVTPKTIVPRR